MRLYQESDSDWDTNKNPEKGIVMTQKNFEKLFENYFGTIDEKLIGSKTKIPGDLSPFGRRLLWISSALNDTLFLLTYRDTDLVYEIVKDPDGAGYYLKVVDGNRSDYSGVRMDHRTAIAVKKFLEKEEHKTIRRVSNLAEYLYDRHEDTCGPGCSHSLDVTPVKPGDKAEK